MFINKKAEMTPKLHHVTMLSFTTDTHKSWIFTINTCNSTKISQKYTHNSTIFHNRLTQQYYFSQLTHTRVTYFPTYTQQCHLSQQTHTTVPSFTTDTHNSIIFHNRHTQQYHFSQQQHGGQHGVFCGAAGRGCIWTWIWRRLGVDGRKSDG